LKKKSPEESALGLVPVPDKENKVLSLQNDRSEVFLTLIFGVSV
jgi:hypothetical protein